MNSPGQARQPAPPSGCFCAVGPSTNGPGDALNALGASPKADPHPRSRSRLERGAVHGVSRTANGFGGDKAANDAPSDGNGETQGNGNGGTDCCVTGATLNGGIAARRERQRQQGSDYERFHAHNVAH